jgi:DNA/RNA endonuclease YhcR with UshA esterase domain
MRILPLSLLLTSIAFVGADEPKSDKPLTPAEAIQRVDKKVLVEMLVKATKNRLEQRKEIYLDSEEDFRSEKNLGIIINVAGAAKFQDAGVEDPAEHFKGKTIRVTGVVTKENEKFRIIVEDPKQIRIVDKK